MKYDGILLVVKDMEASKDFYSKIFGFQVAMDLGENVAFKEGVFLQTMSSWSKFAGIPENEFIFGGKDKELVFTDNDLDTLTERLSSRNIPFVRKEMPWAQRTVVFQDPDEHMVEVGESMDHVAGRLLKEGMSVNKVAEITMVPMEFLEQIAKDVGIRP